MKKTTIDSFCVIFYLSLSSGVKIMARKVKIVGYIESSLGIKEQTKINGFIIKM